VRKSLGISEKKHDKHLLEGKEYHFNTKELNDAIKKVKIFSNKFAISINCS